MTADLAYEAVLESPEGTEKRVQVERITPQTGRTVYRVQMTTHYGMGHYRSYVSIETAHKRMQERIATFIENGYRLVSHSGKTGSIANPGLIDEVSAADQAHPDFGLFA